MYLMCSDQGAVHKCQHSFISEVSSIFIAIQIISRETFFSTHSFKLRLTVAKINSASYYVEHKPIGLSLDFSIKVIFLWRYIVQVSIYSVTKTIVSRHFL